MGQISKLVKEAHETAISKGWWEKEPEFGTLIALCHSELSEALEDYRKGKAPTDVWAAADSPAEIPKLNGIPSELADTIIMIFDMCGRYEIDIEKAILAKMTHNKTRAYKHGGKVI